ncbi:MAG: hypothetical protein OXC98_06835 [bacterium]|nr:hypothetical protein [Acidimicrobiia bacterium]MCY4650067.1 hypothetical protein [bacterium]
MTNRRGKVQTVLGPVPPESVGITLPHEHVLIDMTAGQSSASALLGSTESVERASAQPEAGLEPGQNGPGVAASFTNRWGKPVTLDTRADIERYWFFYGNYRLTDIDDVIYEANLFNRHGGSCLVDQTPRGLARDPRGLAQVARATGVHVVMGTGFYSQHHHPSNMSEMSISRLQELITGDIVDGVAGGIRAGIIGEVGLSWPLSPNEEKSLRASIRSQKATGAPISIHPGYSPDSVWDAIRIVEEEGGDLSRVAFSHVEHRLPSRPAPHSFDPAPFLELAATGASLLLDGFGREASHRQRGPIDDPNDGVRLNYLMTLAEAGYEQQLLISHDLALQHWYRRYGGFGWQHIPETVQQLMRYKGFDQQLIDQILIENPRRLLTFP